MTKKTQLSRVFIFAFGFAIRGTHKASSALHFMVKKLRQGSAAEWSNSLSPSKAAREHHPPARRSTRCPETTQSQPKSWQFSYTTACYTANPLFYFNLCYKSVLHPVQRRYHPTEHVWMLNFDSLWKCVSIWDKTQTIIKVIDRRRCLLFAILKSSDDGFQATDFHVL